MMPRRLASDREGAIAVEFAILAPVFLMMLLGLVEGGRALWMEQSLGEVAYSTARCVSYDTTCSTSTAQKNYAISRASDYALAVQASQVTITTNTTCSGNSGAVKVTISVPFNSAISGLITQLPTTINGQGCFAKLS